MGKDVVVHVAIYRQNMPKLNNYYVVKLIRLCIWGLAFLGKGSTLHSAHIILAILACCIEIVDPLNRGSGAVYEKAKVEWDDDGLAE